LNIAVLSKLYKQTKFAVTEKSITYQHNLYSILGWNVLYL